MSDYLLFLSTEEADIQSAIIRRLTMCDYSHVGFYRKSDSWTFSAMNDGKGVAWRVPNPSAKVLLLDHPQVDAMLAWALTQAGKPYNRAEIASFALNDNMTEPGSYDCCQLVFTAGIQIRCPLLNHRYVPIGHLTPRDILLSPEVSPAT